MQKDANRHSGLPSDEVPALPFRSDTAQVLKNGDNVDHVLDDDDPNEAGWAGKHDEHKEGNPKEGVTEKDEEENHNDSGEDVVDKEEGKCLEEGDHQLLPDLEDDDEDLTKVDVLSGENASDKVDDDGNGEKEEDEEKEKVDNIEEEEEGYAKGEDVEEMGHRKGVGRGPVKGMLAIKLANVSNIPTTSRTCNSSGSISIHGVDGNYDLLV